MTRNEIIRRFPNASEAFIANNLEGAGTGTCSGDKEQHVRNRVAKESGVETEMRSAFSLAVTFRMSDRRVRDLDAGLSTILDCLVEAVGQVRRQLEGRETNRSQRFGSGKG